VHEGDSWRDALPVRERSSQPVRFGLFELDLSAGELRKKGVRVRLQEQPFQILVLLLERPGEVITREELHRKLWPEGTLVDFEHGLNAAINRLRDALDDTAENPRFIETLPRRGYRFIGAVEGREPGIFRRRIPVSPIWIAVITVIVLLVCVLEVTRIWLRPAVRPLDRRVMLVVLPFENLSGDSQQDYFSDGLTEEMISQLGHLQPGKLGVIARTSAMLYKGTRKTVRQIGEELGADYVLEGSVRKEGDRVRITAQLIQVTDQGHLWGETFDREMSGILQLQGEVAQAIAGRIRLTLGTGASGPVALARPVNPAAYEAYLQGRFYWNKLTAESLAAATQYFERATELDPTYGPAYLGLSDSYRLRGSWWGDLAPTLAFPLAKQAAEKALSLDPSLGEAHGGLGWIYFVYDWDWTKAEAEFKRGIELSPLSIFTHSPYANFLRRTRRPAEALSQIEKCLEIDPFAPLELLEATLIHLALNQPEEAERRAREALRVAPDTPAGPRALAYVLMDKGHNAQAIELLEKSTAGGQRDRVALGLLGELYVRVGRKDEAREVLRRLQQEPPETPYSVAVLYLRLGEKEQAIRWFQRAYEWRDPQVVWLCLLSREELRLIWDDPRFQELYRRMDFPQPPAGQAAPASPIPR